MFAITPTTKTASILAPHAAPSLRFREGAPLAPQFGLKTISFGKKPMGRATGLMTPPRNHDRPVGTRLDYYA